VINISEVKQPWEAKSFEELEELLNATLTNGETPIEHITRLLSMRFRQRQGDLRRNAIRKAKIAYLNGSPELMKKFLKEYKGA